LMFVEQHRVILFGFVANSRPINKIPKHPASTQP